MERSDGVQSRRAGPDPAAQAAGASFRIDVWSDIVCPWCAIGRKRLRDVLREDGIHAEIVHRAFELDPNAGPSRSSKVVLQERYPGRDVGAMMSTVRGIGAREGLHLDPEGAIAANTFDAHRLLQWAQGFGHGEAMMDRLVGDHFERGLDLADSAVLLTAGVAVGLPEDGARALLESAALGDKVRSDERSAHAMGVQGVPFFLFTGRVGLSGAQEADLFRKAIAQARGTTGP